MHWLFFISAILALVLAQGEDDCTMYKYDTVNTFRTEKSFSFSCYGVGANCKVYYAPPGSGCNGDLKTLIGTLPENETNVLTFDEGFELGGRFCSDYQIGVYYVDEDTGDITTHLPRATEAGTKFSSGLVIGDGGVSNQCVVSALSLHATVRVKDNGKEFLMSIDPHGFQLFTTSAAEDYPNADLHVRGVELDSDNPIIVSCARVGSKRSATFQPLSLEPLVVNAGVSDIVYVSISECSTFAFNTNHSKVNVVHFNEVGMPCNLTSYDFLFRVEENCLFFIEPLEDFCVSMMLFAADDAALVSMGIPKSKFSTRFVNYPGVEGVNLISFSETTCTSFGSEANEETVLSLDWWGDNLSVKASFLSWSNTSADVSWTECENPVLLVSREDSARFPLLSGYQSEELWQPYFDSICPTQPPSSSDARSLVTGWVVFFAVSLFSSSLLL